MAVLAAFGRSNGETVFTLFVILFSSLGSLSSGSALWVSIWGGSSRMRTDINKRYRGAKKGLSPCLS